MGALTSYGSDDAATPDSAEKVLRRMRYFLVLTLLSGGVAASGLVWARAPAPARSAAGSEPSAWVPHPPPLDPTSCLPQLVGIGVQKGGTTSFHHLLKSASARPAAALLQHRLYWRLYVQQAHAAGCMPGEVCRARGGSSHRLHAARRMPAQPAAARPRAARLLHGRAAQQARLWILEPHGTSTPPIPATADGRYHPGILFSKQKEL